MVTINQHERDMLDGARGSGVAMAMRIIVALAERLGADALLPITGAHIDSCLYHGRSGIDFAMKLSEGEAAVAVPTTLNVSSLDLLHPDLYRGDPGEAEESRQLMALYEGFGCEPTWTCAPYDGAARPGLGEHVAWAESNAIVFANSVLGARTARYGDFVDICAALTARVPAAGLHLDHLRRGQIVVDVRDVAPRLLDSDGLAPVLGYVIGALAGSMVPVVIGLEPNQPEHRLKSLGAAAASSGGVALVHVVGSTPEAPSLDAALHGQPAERTVVVKPDELRTARQSLQTAGANEPLGALCLGTPHYGVEEFSRLVRLLDGRALSPRLRGYVNTSRAVWNEVSLRGWGKRLTDAGFQPVVDTCTYIAPVMAPFDGFALTDSAKWAHYAPGNLGVDVRVGSIEACVESGVEGRLVDVDADLWGSS